MRHLVFRLLALALLAASSFVHAAWDSQKCDLSKPETTPTSRFKIDTADGTVYDSKTKLTWKLCAEGQNYTGNGRCNGEAKGYKWDDAIATFGDKSVGWRMPNIDELNSLIEKRCKDLAVNLAVFPDWPKTPSQYWEKNSDFWSASAQGSKYAWFVFFTSGYDHSYYKTDVHAVRLVRGGQFFDPLGALAKQEKELAEAQRKKQQELAEVQRKQAEDQRKKQQELAEAERRKQQELAEAQRKAEEQRKEQQYHSTLNGPSPRAMYLLAAQMEDQNREDRAKELYRKIMSAFADSDFAIKAGDRLTQLRDVGNIADGAKRAAERVAESNRKAAEKVEESNRQAANEQRRDAERTSEEQRNRQRRNCESSHSQCVAMCNGMSDRSGGGPSPQTLCKWDCDHARGACR